MAQNAQQKRVSKNRVSITFDVEDGGAVQQKELAFVLLLFELLHCVLIAR